MVADPIDFKILEPMSDGPTQTATILAALIDNESRYTNNRLATPAGGGFVERVGPSDNFGLYIITRRSLRHWIIGMNIATVPLTNLLSGWNKNLKITNHRTGNKKSVK